MSKNSSTLPGANSRKQNQGNNQTSSVSPMAQALFGKSMIMSGVKNNDPESIKTGLELAHPVQPTVLPPQAQNPDQI